MAVVNTRQKKVQGSAQADVTACRSSGVRAEEPLRILVGSFSVHLPAEGVG